MSFQDEIEKLKEGLLQQRDELKVKASLAKLEAREEWEKVEEKVDHLMVKLEALSGEAAGASEDVLKSAKQLGEEVKTAYERIKSKL
jgi:hypothetical protein